MNRIHSHSPQRNNAQLNKSSRILPLLACLSLAMALPIGGATMAFIRITTNSPTDYSSALSAQILDFGPQAVLLLSMDETPPGFINQVYIEDPDGLFSDITFSSALSSHDLTALRYTAPATPGHPPGVSPFTVDFSFDANPQAPQYGINNNETGAFIATFSNGTSFTHVEQALENQALRVGLHLQGLEPNAEESDSYLSLPPGGDDPPIPEPSSLLLAILALGITARWRR